MSNLVGILDYGCGNVRSVSNAVKSVGGQFVLCQTEEDISSVSKLILPGVGAFDRAMSSLKEKNILESLQRYIQNKENKLLGICLGMQILCHSSDEGEEKGLGIIDAHVHNLAGYTSLKIPHMGWNSVAFVQEDPLLVGVKDLSDFYFVHSYCVQSRDKKVNLGLSTYGAEFSSIVRQDNVWGVQFHLEKSQKTGLTLMKNFVHL